MQKTSDLKQTTKDALREIFKCSLRRNEIVVELQAAHVAREVHVCGADVQDEAFLATEMHPQLPADIQGDDDWSGKVGLEEGFCIGSSSHRLEGIVLVRVLSTKGEKRTQRAL